MAASGRAPGGRYEAGRPLPTPRGPSDTSALYPSGSYQGDDHTPQDKSLEPLMRSSSAFHKQCQGLDFAARRDAALLRLLLDTGARRGEVEWMRTDAIDLPHGEALITGKTGTRGVPLGRKTVVGVDRYLRVRGSTQRPRSHGSSSARTAA